MRVCPQCGFRAEERICPRDGLPMVEEGLFGKGEPAPELVGRMFGDRYQVESLIGLGGMGWVFKATHLVMQQTVALKVMRQEVARDMSAVKRFYQEARACSQLGHHNTIKVHDFGVSDDGFPYIVMEFLRGRPLNEVLKVEGAFPTARAIRIATQICKSLDEAHEVGLVHRDLKPANIFLTRMHGEEDYVKVLDFGIAKFVSGGDRREHSLTQSGMVIGTPKYLSPEQAQAKTLDRRSDLYSLGIILYEMLLGEVPFDAPSTGALLVKQIQEAPRPLPETVDGRPIPPALRRVVLQLLAKNRAERPTTAIAVAQYLEAVGEGKEPPNLASAPALVDAKTLLRPSAEPETKVLPEGAAAPEVPDPTTPLPGQTKPPETGLAHAGTAPASAASGLSPSAGTGIRDSTDPSMEAADPTLESRELHAARRRLSGWKVGTIAAVLVAVVLAGILIATSGESGSPAAPETGGAPAAMVGQTGGVVSSTGVPDPAPAALIGTPVEELDAGTRAATAMRDVTESSPDPALTMRAADAAGTSEEGQEPSAESPVVTGPADVAPPPHPVRDIAPVQIKVTVRVLSVPEGATVREGETVLGVTPLDLPVVLSHSRHLVLELEGYEPERRVVSAAVGPELTVGFREKTETTRRTRRPKRPRTPRPPKPTPTGVRIDYL